MSHHNPHVRNKAHKASRTIFDALQGMAETTINIWRQMGDVQRKSFSAAVDASQTQLQLIGKVSALREFASAQADLLKEYGEKYVASINETVEVMSQAWQEYGNRLEELRAAATGDMQDAVSIAAHDGKNRH
jgi:hypothetical protein